MMRTGRGWRRFRRRMRIARGAWLDWRYRLRRRPRRRRRSGSRKVLLQLGRWKLTTASLLSLAAVGGIGYWLYNNKKKTGKWL